MATKVQKSRTFAVILQNGPHLDVFCLFRLTKTNSRFRDEDTDLSEETFSRELSWNHTRTPWPASQKSALIDLLTKAGLTVRHYDPEHKIWMDQSLSEGAKPAPGSREGSWTLPDLETFERDYLT